MSQVHPLGRYAVPFGITLLVLAFLWWALGPIVGYVQQFWPALAIALGIVGILWAFATQRVRTAIESFLAVPLTRGILTAALLTAVYVLVLWIGFGPVASWLQDQLGIEQRWAWLLVAVLGFLAIPVLWRLYAAAGIPGDPKVIGRGFRVLALLVLAFFGWWYHNTPNRLFDLKTGKSLFWIAEREGRIYFSPGFSPETGEQLRRGLQSDVVRYRRSSWTEPIQQWFREWSSATQSYQPAASAATFPLQYAGITPVSGSLAPRPTPATIVTAKGEGIWEVSIDGSNEYGYAEPASGHRTKIMVRPGEKFVIQHLGGIPAINAHGDRVALCGAKRTVYKWEQRRFQDEPLYAVGVVTLGPTWPFRFTPWKCGRTDFELKNAGTEPFELALWFNLNEVYRTPDGRDHSDGFAYAGWDGERVRFEVRRMPPGT